MVYFDHAAGTKTDKSILDKMMPYLQNEYGNPSSIYQLGRKSRAAIDEARKVVATILNCAPGEIYFTGSGTESNNWAIFGIMKACGKKHIITSRAEHHSVLNPIEELERDGFRVTFLPLDRFGRISLQDLEKAITPETGLVSIMYTNNEVGTVEHIEEIGKLLRSKNVIFHTDACQAGGVLQLNVKELNVDVMSLNGGKIYGPKGVGVLYIREGVKITPLLYGGGQEHRLRAGTENVANIVGFAEALKIAEQLRGEEVKRLNALKKKLLEGLQKAIPGIKINGDPIHRLPGNINITIPGISAESLVVRLDMEGFCVAIGSACTSGVAEPSHVLLAIGLSEEEAKSSIRITLGRENTEAEIEKFLKILPKLVQDLKATAH